MNKITNITNKICPYARKVSIVLREKSSEFNEVQVDLQNKSEYFKESYSKAIGRNPGKDGMVPILIDDGVYLSESEPLVWYVAEKFRRQGYDVIPEDNVERFKMRLFIDEFVKKIIALQSKYFGWNNKSEDDKKKQIQQVSEFLDSLQKKVVLPYALGEQFTIADILIYSHLELWSSIEHFTGSGIDQKYEKIHKYINELQKRKSIHELIQTKETYIEALKKFF